MKNRGSAFCVRWLKVRKTASRPIGIEAHKASCGKNSCRPAGANQKARPIKAWPFIHIKGKGEEYNLVITGSISK